MNSGMSHQEGAGFDDDDDDEGMYGYAADDVDEDDMEEV